ncbi:unnamed protein product [Rhodiola kirilowii]
MRWHANRNKTDPEYIRHPANGESWQNFDKDFPEFASEIINVRLGLATDGFNPFGASGPKSPGKCLNVFMRPLIDELKVLWDEGCCTFDRHVRSPFIMKAAVMWAIIDFPGLGMLGGLKTKRYKAYPLCLDEIDATHITGRMSYQGHRRWLSRNHDWRFAAHRFNGRIETRDPPTSFLGPHIFNQIMAHDYPILSFHLQFKPRGSAEKLC